MSEERKVKCVQKETDTFVLVVVLAVCERESVSVIHVCVCFLVANRNCSTKTNCQSS